MELIKTTRGERKLCYDGHMYVKKTEYKKNNKITWTCVKRHPPIRCPARLSTDKDLGKPEVFIPHTHAPSEERIHLEKTKYEMKQLAKTSLQNPSQIYTFALTSISDEVKAIFPSPESFQRTLRSIRAKNRPGESPTTGYCDRERKKKKKDDDDDNNSNTITVSVISDPNSIISDIGSTTEIITTTACCDIVEKEKTTTVACGMSDGFLDVDPGEKKKGPGEKKDRKVRYKTIDEFMEQYGVNQGSYVKFLLGMNPTEVDVDSYRGNPLYIHPSRKIAFGGCLLGQALSAAIRSVPDGQIVHSLHNYFLNAGREGSIDYHVENVRDGFTYCNRFVKAMQNGKNVVNMQVSFKKEEDDPFKFQWTMPACQRPEELQSATQLMEAKLTEDLSEELKKTLQDRLPVDPVVEFRPVDPEAMYRIKPLPPKRLTWVRIVEKLDDDPNFHRCAMAFLSDYLIITTALLPNDNSSQKFFLTSLDHSIWFHCNFRADEWLLYETESSQTGSGIGFSTGRFWTQDGRLVASVAQQGVVRSLL